MKLFLRRSQREAGIMGGKVVFALDARIDPTEEEKNLIKKYKLGKLSVYNSETAQKHINAGAASLATGNAVGVAKAFMRIGMAAISLRCTVDSLCSGQHIECKDMEELLGAEEAIRAACQTTKLFLETAATFDGREDVFEF